MKTNLCLKTLNDRNYCLKTLNDRNYCFDILIQCFHIRRYILDNDITSLFVLHVVVRIEILHRIDNRVCAHSVLRVGLTELLV